MTSSASKIETKKTFFLLAFFLGLKLLFCIFLILKAGIALAPDEAQYWTWSRHLDWGYYSKPPGIAWQIWLTTSIWGNTEFGVRFGALLWSLALPLVIFFRMQKMKFSLRSAFWGAMIGAFSPLGVFLSFPATTDAGATFFFLLAATEVALGLAKNKTPSYPLVGLWLLLGALFKWVVFLFWPLLLFLFFFFPLLRHRSLGVGLLISLLAFLPSLYWNQAHEWATFRHVGRTVVASSGSKASSGNFFDFLGAQIALLSPIYFGLLCAIYYKWVRLARQIPSSLKFCGGITAAVLVYVLLAIFKKMQPNWALFLYPPSFLLIAWGALHFWKTGTRWLQVGTILSVLMCLSLLFIPQIQSSNLFPSWPLSYRVNPFRQNLGWNRLASILEESGYQSSKDFLFGESYQITSLLSFYGPDQQRAYFFNLRGRRKNQFSYWPTLGEQERGKTGYFVIAENISESSVKWFEEYYPPLLKPFFSSIEFIGAYPLFEAYGKPVKMAMVFLCRDFLGRIPSDPKIY